MLLLRIVRSLSVDSSPAPDENRGESASRSVVAVRILRKFCMAELYCKWPASSIDHGLSHD